MALCCFVGWGLVVNGFDTDAPWNNWQGYILDVCDARDSIWATGNIGVIIALAMGFFGYAWLCFNRVRRQETL